MPGSNSRMVSGGEGSLTGSFIPISAKPKGRKGQRSCNRDQIVYRNGFIDRVGTADVSGAEQNGRNTAHTDEVPHIGSIEDAFKLNVSHS